MIIIDYGMGNLRSILNKLQRLDANVLISSKIEEIERADKLILPGVGFFAKGMDNLKRLNLIPILNKKNNNDLIVATTNYGYDFGSIVYHNNIIGTQFHPEKSHKDGIQVLKDFVEKF